MIGQRRPKLTAAAERAAYAAATRRDQGRCQRCGRAGIVERDHRQNRTPFNTTPANLQCLCRACHQWKTEHPRDAREQGYALSRYDDPATALAYRIGYGWVVYYDYPDEHGHWWRVATTDEVGMRRSDLVQDR